MSISTNKKVKRMVEPRKRSKLSLAVPVILALIMLILCLTAACQPSPTGDIVKNKKQDGFMSGLTTDNTQAAKSAAELPTSIRNIFADYTKSWVDTIRVKPHKITVKIDAKVITPVTDKMPVYSVSPEKITQDQVNSFLSLFGNAQYHLNTQVKTKSDYQQIILDLEKRLAELPNSKDYTDDQKEQVKKDLEEGLKNNMTFVQSAPETLDDVIKPVFTDEFIIARDSQPEIIVPAPGDTQTPDNKQHETARQHYEKTHTTAINVKWTANNVPMTLDIQRSDEPEGNSFRFSANQAEYLSINVAENTSDLKGLHTTYQDAKSMAVNAISKLGLGYMSIAASAKGISYTDLTRSLNRTGSSYFTDFSKLNYNNVIYIFYFTRIINKVNETYCSNGISYNQYDEPWPYSRMSVAVDDSDIREIDWQSSGSKLGNKISDDSKLMPFEQIQKIAKQQFNDGNISFSGQSYYDGQNFKGLVKMDLSIDKIVLGYARVKLSGSNGRYVLVPVWDFFGSFVAVNNSDKANPDFKQYSKEQEGLTNYMHSFLTINAIDGSVIDRSLGY